jgi:hypothetical protein
MSVKVLASSLVFVFLSAQIAKADDIANLKNIEIKDAYEDSSGRLMVRFKDKYGETSDQNPKFFGQNLTFYGTDRDLYQLEGSDQGGVNDSYQYQFNDPRLPKKGNQTVGDFYSGLDKSGNVASEYSVVCGDESKSIDYKPLSKKRLANLEDTIRHGRTKLNSLPQDARSTEYLFKKPDGTMIYIDSAKYGSSYDSFRVFVGKPGQMKEKKVKNVERFRDGGTTNVVTETGEKMISPTPFSGKSPTWNGVDIKKVDSQKYDLASLGIKGVPSTNSGAAHTPCDKFYQPKSTTPTVSGPKARERGDEDLGRQ